MANRVELPADAPDSGSGQTQHLNIWQPVRYDIQEGHQTEVLSWQRIAVRTSLLDSLSCGKSFKLLEQANSRFLDCRRLCLGR
jgi:hypothetical protein